MYTYSYLPIINYAVLQILPQLIELIEMVYTGGLVQQDPILVEEDITIPLQW
jgi:hypothetical protein